AVPHAKDFAADLAHFQKTSAEAVALSDARLKDVELRLRAQLPGTSLCGRHVTGRLAKADAQRKERFVAVHKASPSRRAALIFRAGRVPSPASRELGRGWSALSPGLGWVEEGGAVSPPARTPRPAAAGGGHSCYTVGNPAGGPSTTSSRHRPLPPVHMAE